MFVVVFTVDGWTRRGYRPMYHSVSALALGERGWLQTWNFIVAGCLIGAGSIGAFGAMDSFFGPGLLVIFAASLVASGVFPMDAMRGYPPGTPEGDPPDTTRRHRLHDGFGGAVFISLPAACVAVGIAQTDLGWRSYSFASAAILATLFVVFASAWERDAPNTGLIQRGMMVLGWFWVALTFLQLA